MKSIHVIERSEFEKNPSDYPARTLSVSGDLKLTFIKSELFVFAALDSSSSRAIVMLADYNPVELVESVDCLSVFGIDSQTIKSEFDKFS